MMQSINRKRTRRSEEKTRMGMRQIDTVQCSRSHRTFVEHPRLTLGLARAVSVSRSVGEREPKASNSHPLGPIGWSVDPYAPVWPPSDGLHPDSSSTKGYDSCRRLDTPLCQGRLTTLTHCKLHSALPARRGQC